MPFPSSNFGPPFPFNLIPYVIGAGFLLVFGLIAFTLLSNLTQWMSDNAAPVETVEARIIGKRAKATRHQSNGANNSTSRWTSYSYFVAFEYSNGERKEFGVRESEFGILLEGDKGTLNFQGSRYNSFQRQI